MIIDIPQIFIPQIPFALNGAPGVAGNASFDLNGATNRCEILLRAPATGSISKIGFGTATVTTGCTLRISIEGIDYITGRSNQTLLGTDTSATQVVANTDDNVWFETSLVSSANVTAGDWFAVSFSVDSGTPSALQINTFADNANWYSAPLINYNGSTYASYNAGAVLVLVYNVNGTDTTYLTNGCFPTISIATSSYNTGTTLEVNGNQFTLPFSCRADGVWIVSDLDGDSVIELLNSSNTVIASLSVNKNIPLANTGILPYVLQFSSSIELSANTIYKLMHRPTTTSNITQYVLSCYADDYMTATPGGSAWVHVNGQYAGGYSNLTTYSNRQSFIGLSIDGIGFTPDTSYVFAT